MSYSLFDPANDELVAHTEAILATLEKFDPAVRLRLAQIFTEGLLEDVRASVEEAMPLVHVRALP